MKDIRFTNWVADRSIEEVWEFINSDKAVRAACIEYFYARYNAEPAFPYTKRIQHELAVVCNGVRMTLHSGTKVRVLGIDKEYDNLRVCELSATSGTFYLDIEEINYEG